MELLTAIQAGDIGDAGFQTSFMNRSDWPGNPAMAATNEQVEYLMDHLASTCRLHDVRSCGVKSSLVVPMLPARFYSADHFGAIEGLRQHVPSA